MIQPTKVAQIDDLTALAVRAKNLQAGSAPGAVQPQASAGSAALDRGPAVRMDERTRELADAVARQGAEGDAAGASRPSTRRPLFDAHAEMLEARTQTHLHRVENRKRLAETIRLYEETGKVYSVQPTGNYEMDEQGLLRDHGGAEAYMREIHRRLDQSHTLIAEAAKALGGSSSDT